MEVAEEYKETKIGRIPKDWEVTQLGELCEVITKGTTPTTNGFSYLEDGINFVKVESIDSFGGFIEKMFAYVGEDCHKSFKRSQLQEGDILISIAGALGRTAIVTNNILPANTNQAVGILRLQDKSLNRFIRYFLDSNYLQKFIERINVASAQANLNLGHLNKFHIAFPPLNEQQKIAEILSTVDEQISTTQAIIDKSKELKKGLMQKLFSEGIGHTEFKDTKIGRIPKDWEVVKLNEVGLIKVGRDLNKEIYNPTHSKVHKVPVYSNAISDRGLYGFYSTSEYPKNSITITGRGDIGYAFARNEEFGAIGRLIVIQPNSNIDYIFLTNYINHCVNFHIETSGIPQLTGVQASAYKVAIPSLKEQHKIAEILSEADAKIEKERNEKAKLEELKKGLMQQLLTGKKRVKV